MICGNQGDLFITNNKEDYQRKCKFLESSLILLHLFLEQFFTVKPGQAFPSLTN